MAQRAKANKAVKAGKAKAGKAGTAGKARARLEPTKKSRKTAKATRPKKATKATTSSRRGATATTRAKTRKATKPKKAARMPTVAKVKQTLTAAKTRGTRIAKKAAAVPGRATAAKAATALASSAAAAAIIVKATASQRARRIGKTDPARRVDDAGTNQRPRVPETSARTEPAAKQRRGLPAWMADHLERYLATNGADGHIWRGVPTLLLTTTGRTSGEPRILPLIYSKDGNRYVVVASKGGAPDHPAWYKNLVAQPMVDVQVAADRFRGRARTANPDDRPRLWRMMAKIWPDYDKYQATTRREIPVVIIERT